MKLAKTALAIGLAIGCATGGALASPAPSFNFLQPNTIDLGNVSPGSIPDQTFYFVLNDLNPVFQYNLTTSSIVVSNITGSSGANFDLGAILLSNIVVGLGSFELSYVMTLTEFNDCAGDDDCTYYEAKYNSDKMTLKGNAVSAVPVPAALPLLASAVGILGFIERRRRKRTTPAIDS